jgi:hypothetical protein
VSERIELSLHQRSQVEVARLTLAEIDGTKLEDAASAAHMVGRLEASLRSLLAIVDGADRAAAPVFDIEQSGADSDGWDPDDPHGDVDEYERGEQR